MNLPKPYHETELGRLYHGDCLEILPHLEKVDLVLTDPPYGINRCCGMGGGGYSLNGNKRNPSVYEGGWDKESVDEKTIKLILSKSDKSIIWGGNYFSNFLPASRKWLIWDKQQTMPSFSDAEIAWTNLDGTSTKMITYRSCGYISEEKERYHPTQKPVAVFKWCLGFYDGSVIDPFFGVGTTALACERLKRRWIGIEIEEKYCEIAAKRIELERKQLKLF
jgi:DNA modification methylase